MHSHAHVLTHPPTRNSVPRRPLALSLTLTHLGVLWLTPSHSLSLSHLRIHALPLTHSLTLTHSLSLTHSLTGVLY